MRKFVQVSIPEKLYNVILEICKLEPREETDGTLPEDYPEGYIEAYLASKVEAYITERFYDEQALEAISPVIAANREYKKEWWNDIKEKYPNDGFVCIWDAIFPEEDKKEQK